MMPTTSFQTQDYNWYSEWSEWDLENELIRFEKMLNSPSFKKFSLARRARYGKRRREVQAALLALRLAK